MNKFAVVLLIALLISAPAFSAHSSSAGVQAAMQTSKFTTAFAYRQQGAKVTSRKQAIAMVKAQFSGKMLSVNAIELNGRKGYQAKLLSGDGTVYYVFVDAKTGKMRRR